MENEKWRLTQSTKLFGIADEAIVADTNGAMHLWMTATVEPAGIESARIDTSVIPASFVVGTFRVGGTFGAWLILDFGIFASDLWVADEARRTRANGLVIGGSADGIDSAGTDARIATSLRETSSVSWTISVNYALRIDAERHSVPHSTFTVGVAWRWIARIQFCSNKTKKLIKRFGMK